LASTSPPWRSVRTRQSSTRPARRSCPATRPPPPTTSVSRC
jgi:hypothetical protein